MKHLLILVFSMFVANISFAATGLEEANVDKESNYLFSPYGESELTAVLTITQMELDLETADSDAETSFGVGINVDMGAGTTKFVSGLHYLQFKSEKGIVDQELSYLMIPLAVKHYIMGAESGLYLKGGINPMILVKGEAGNDDKAFKGFDLLGNVGLGYRIAGGGNDFMIEVSYNLGLMDINDIDGSTEEAKNQGLTFGLGMHF